MSHIDSYKHEIVGLFGSLPVYHPLEDIPEPATDQLLHDLAAQPSNL
jgi:hypothetical protein